MRSVGRFAPSPTGELHFGSLLAAVASCLQARSKGGQWLVRIEDIDPPRELAGSARRIIQDLGRLGLVSDLPVLYQSTRTEAYRAACDQLVRSGKAYWCGCSRKDLPASGVYPGTCRQGIAQGKKARAIRIRVDNKSLTFADKFIGLVSENLQHTCGDFIIRRADGLYAYQLAVVVDDAWQKVTEVVRGMDLLSSTTRQIWLQNCLSLPTPEYAHIPLAVRPDGQKLSKRLASDPICLMEPVQALRAALTFLGHPPPLAALYETWQWAYAHWSPSRVGDNGVSLHGYDRAVKMYPPGAD